MAREAEMMCAWMIKNNKPIDFCDFVPREIVDSHIVRFETLNVMINILEESSAAGHRSDKEGPASRNGHGGDGDGDGITADGEANNTTGYGCVPFVFLISSRSKQHHRELGCCFLMINIVVLLSPGAAFQMYWILSIRKRLKEVKRVRSKKVSQNLIITIMVTMGFFSPCNRIHI
jgi:hypothetical protein